MTDQTQYYVESRDGDVPVTVLGRTFAGGDWRLVVVMDNGYHFTAIGNPVLYRKDGREYRQDATEQFPVIA